MSALDTAVQEPEPEGRLYLGFFCAKCVREFPVCIAKVTFLDPGAMARCRPPCPICDRAGVLRKDSRMFACLDGGAVKTPTPFRPYAPPPETDSEPPPRRYG